MSLDLPDFTRKVILELKSTKDYFGDLANRLGFPMSINNTGEVIGFCDFSDGLGNISYKGVGVGYAHNLTSQFYYTGGFSLQMTSGSALNGYAAMNLLSPFSGLSKYGYEVRFSSNNDLKYIFFELVFNYLAVTFYFALRYNIADQSLYVLDNGTWRKILTLALPLDDDLTPLNVLKFIVDPAAKKYDNVIINNQEVDLSGYGSTVYAPIGHARVVGMFQITTEGAVGDTVYLDSIILTKNENITVIIP